MSQACLKQVISGNGNLVGFIALRGENGEKPQQGEKPLVLLKMRTQNPMLLNSRSSVRCLRWDDEEGNKDVGGLKD